MTIFGPRLTADGLLPGARFAPSQNCDERPSTERTTLVVIHAISLPPGQFGGDAIERLFTNSLDPEAHAYYRGIHSLRVSTHFLIRRDGSIIQFVPAGKRAWHAGVSTWRSRDRCNDFSLGIELEGSDTEPFEEIQYIRLARLIRVLCKRFPIEDIVGHADIAPLRKADPGPCFDWARLRRMLPNRYFQTVVRMRQTSSIVA